MALVEMSDNLLISLVVPLLPTTKKNKTLLTFKEIRNMLEDQGISLTYYKIETTYQNKVKEIYWYLMKEDNNIGLLIFDGKFSLTSWEEEIFTQRWLYNSLPVKLQTYIA